MIGEKITITELKKSFSVNEFIDIVQRDLDGVSTAAEKEILAANKSAWIASLLRLLDDARSSLDQAKRNLRGSERMLVVPDLESEHARINEVLTQLIGPPKQPVKRFGDDVATGISQLQLSWQPGKIVVWSSGYLADSKSESELKEQLEIFGGDSIEWKTFNNLIVPGKGKVEALSAPISKCLGWLVALGDSLEDESIGLSVAWMGFATTLAVKLVAQGRAVPQLRKHRRKRNDNLSKGAAVFEARWSPALIDSKEFTDLTRALPGCVGIFDDKNDRKVTTAVILNDLVTAIFREATNKVEYDSSHENPESLIEISETFLTKLDGENFVTSAQLGSELSKKIDQWSKPVTGTQKSKLIVQLDPPTDNMGWYLSVFAKSSDKKIMPVEQVIVNSSAARSKEVEDDLRRLERLFPELMRPGAKRRGEVILDQEEAWRLMSQDGAMLLSAGYEVRAPAIAKKKPAPTLRLTAEETTGSLVGAQQLANVSWSVVFNDIELSAEDIKNLASEAKPMVESNGRWVELDKLDLKEAAKALEERADQTKLTGADMLRQALGLEGLKLSGGVTLAGRGWASDLLKSASNVGKDLSTKLEGFNGELRSYQAEARAWLAFLDNAGLGGCLALDMGLGKTPTMLAHLEESKVGRPSMVIAPPAVVSNWLSETKKFVPNLSVKVHHGPTRDQGESLVKMAGRYDLIITTYGTVIRDIDDLEKVEWDKVVLDEAQAIKNPASETSKHLRKLQATTRVALTGTPIENGLGDLWSIMDFVNPGLVGHKASFVAQLSTDNDTKKDGESALKALNGILVFRRTKAEPAIAAELPDRIDELDQCAMTEEQIGLYQAVLDRLMESLNESDPAKKPKGAVLAAITALKQICNHPAAYKKDDDGPLEGRSGKLTRLNQIMETVFASDERILIFTHFAEWGVKMADYLTHKHNMPISCYHGGLSRKERDAMVDYFQKGKGAGAMVVSLKAGGTGLNLTAANHVVLYDRWWNPAVEDQARDRVWRIGQKNTVICHRLVCPGTVDERVEEVVAGKRKIAETVLPKSSTVEDLEVMQLQTALGLDPDILISDLEADEVEVGS